MNYKIINGELLLPDPEGDAFRTVREDLYVNNGVIAAIGAHNGTETYETVDAKDRLVMPGLINMHTHAYMTGMRNYADDVDFDEWLFRRVMPVEDTLPRESAYWTSLLGCMEMLRTGTTCFVDMHMFHEQSCKAANTAGMRAFIGRGLVGDDLYEEGNNRFREAIEEKERYESDRIRFILSPHAPYTCSVKLLEQVAAEAAARHMLKQTHLSESAAEIENSVKQHGKTPVRLLSEIGFLDENTILAHCAQMRENDIALLKESGASVVTNPASNAKLGNGFAPVVGMHEAGINICIGTDGAASNNTLNMFREMNLLSLMQKGVQRSSTAAPAAFVVGATTENAAKALHMEGRIGVIREGAYADLTFLDLTEPSLFPNNNIVSSLCYSANGAEVDSVMIAGQWTLRNREWVGIDAEQVRYEVKKIAEKYL